MPNQSGSTVPQASPPAVSGLPYLLDQTYISQM